MENMTLIMVPKEDWQMLMDNQRRMIATLEKMAMITATRQDGHITAMEFMQAVRIKRTKFDELVMKNKIKTIKKGRKIYVPATEIDRYFSEH